MTKHKGGAIVDLGNVIIAHWMSNTTPENFVTIDYNSIPEVPGAFDGLKQLNDLFAGNVTVVYKATDIATEKILGWLAHHQFVERTGIPLERVRRTEGGRDKTLSLEQSSPTNQGTTLVIDDRLEVMTYFAGKVSHLFLFRSQPQEVQQFSGSGALAHVTVVQTWEEIMRSCGRMRLMNGGSIREEFNKIKKNKFLCSQSKKERAGQKPVTALYIRTWLKVQTFLIYRLRIKSPFAIVKTFWGESIKMILPRPTFLYFYGFLGKSEIFLTDVLIDTLKEGDVFIDGGANIGFFSLLASSLVGETGSVHSFEPTPTTFSVLKENLAHKKNVQVNQAALWSKAGQVSFIDNGLEDNLYNSIESSGHDGKKVTIDAITIDEYCRQKGILPTVIKLDTEGTEYDILLGAKCTLAEHHPKVLIEILPESITNGTFDKIVDLLGPSYSCKQFIRNFEMKSINTKDDVDRKFYNFGFF